MKTEAANTEARINPDGWNLDWPLLNRPGNIDVQLDLFGDYRSNVALYPQFQRFFREHRPPTLVVWGRNEPISAALQEADGIVFGCPTLMGMVSAPFKAFMEGAFQPWARQGWKCLRRLGCGRREGLRLSKLLGQPRRHAARSAGVGA